MERRKKLAQGNSLDIELEMEDYKLASNGTCVCEQDSTYGTILIHGGINSVVRHGVLVVGQGSFGRQKVVPSSFSLGHSPNYLSDHFEKFSALTILCLPSCH